MSKNDKVGYKNPPKNTQWKKGQSGNPKGRPKIDPETPFVTIFAKELQVVVETTDKQGNVQAFSKKEIIIKYIINQAMNGNKEALRLLIKIGMHGQAIYWL